MVSPIYSLKTWNSLYCFSDEHAPVRSKNMFLYCLVIRIMCPSWATGCCFGFACSSHHDKDKILLCLCNNIHTLVWLINNIYNIVWPTVKDCFFFTKYCTSDNFLDGQFFQQDHASLSDYATIDMNFKYGPIQTVAKSWFQNASK